MKNFTSTKIEAIKTDSAGFKLIAFSKVIEFPKCKPQVSPCRFADFKDGILRVFDRSEHKSYQVGTWRNALCFLRLAF